MKIVGVQIPPPAPSARYPARARRSREMFDRLCSRTRNRRKGARIATRNVSTTAMNVTETSAEGLKREFKITIPASEVEDKITKRLDEVGRMARIPGFRPGKVPLMLLRKRYGAAVRGEVLESAVQDSSAAAIRERNLRPALPPRFELVSSAEGADLEYTLSLEVLPEMPAPDFAGLGLEKMVAQVPDDDVEKALERLAESQRKSEPVERPGRDRRHRRRRRGRSCRRRGDPRQPRRGPRDRARRRGAAARVQRPADRRPRPAKSATSPCRFLPNPARKWPARRGSSRSR